MNTDKSREQLARELLACEGWTLLMLPRIAQLLKATEEALLSKVLTLEQAAAFREGRAVLLEIRDHATTIVQLRCRTLHE